MSGNKDIIYLPIRAFGDFISTASIVKNYCLEKVPTIMPYYLKDFFKAIGGNKYFEVVGSINYQDQPAFYEFYKVKNIKNIQRLWKDTKTIYSSLNTDNEYLLDFHSKRLYFTMANLRWPEVKENIYKGKYKLFSNYFTFKKEQAPNFSHNDKLNKTAFSKVLIIPDSRIKTKEINKKIVKAIQVNFNTIKIDAAYFSQNTFNENACVSYSNFNQLITLIDDYDLIISAESLPYHLANFYNKPHFVIYNNTRHFDKNFMTPFMIANNYYINHTKNNFTDIINKLENILINRL